jgi:acetylornithine deacetylase/succinyl-diaminopimelate desuccinylase-like protein
MNFSPKIEAFSSPAFADYGNLFQRNESEGKRVPGITRGLLGIGVLAALLTGSVRAASPPTAPPPQDAATAKSILAELLAIDTTYEKGTVAAVEALRKRFIAGGFPTADLVVVANPSTPAQSNLIVKLKGHGRGKPLLYLCHLDVVAAKPDDWTVPPFALTEKDGWLYGRGSLDMKGDDANVATALLRLKREGYVPARDIIVAFTADEESAGGEGVAWLVKTHRDLIDAGLVLNPDDGTAAFRDGRRAFYGVQTSEKTYVTFVAEAVNKGGHSSEPRSDNAIYELTAALQRLAAFKFPIRLTDTTRAFYASQAPFETGARQEYMRAVGKGDINAAEHLAADPSDNARLRTTCVATMLEAGHAENALPQRARATIQCRMLPGETQEHVQAELQGVFADPGLKITITVPAASGPESPPTEAVMAIYTRVVHSMWPGLPVMPSMDAGASDSVYTRAAGMPSYGAISNFFDLEDYRAHGQDERIKADRFVEGGEFAYRLMKAFSGAAAP